jgi:hypothetical protein
MQTLEDQFVRAVNETSHAWDLLRSIPTHTKLRSPRKTFKQDWVLLSKIHHYEQIERAA